MAWNKSLYRTEQDSAKNFFIWLKPRFFVNFQSRQKTPSFETLPSEKSIKLDLGRVRLEKSLQDFSCERGDQQVAQRKCLMLLLFSGATTLQIGRKVLDSIQYLFMERKTAEKKRKNWVDFVQANQILSFVFDALPRRRLYSEVFPFNWGQSLTKIEKR